MKYTTILLRWNERAIRGYADLLPATILAGHKERECFEHRVQGPRGGEYRAKCRLTGGGTSVDLDYERFSEFNLARDMELGVLRLDLGDANRGAIEGVKWKQKGTSRFEVADVDVEYTSPPPGRLDMLYEGAVRRLLRNGFVRSARARQMCVVNHGSACVVCGFDFGQTYGPVADGFIHVHHLKPLSKGRRRHRVDPVTDLRPICANCHAAIHLQNPEFSLEQLSRMVARSHGAPPPNATTLTRGTA